MSRKFGSRLLQVSQWIIVFGALRLASFLILSSRPTADEYLTAPIFNGYYVDLADGKLFSPSSSLLVRYFQGVRAIVGLGWDGLFNAMTFQMGSSIGVNYFGPIASMILGLLFVLIFFGFAQFTQRHILGLRHGRIFGTSVMFVGTAGALSVANFNTYRPNFGLFPLLGIRFGLYATLSWVLLAFSFWILNSLILNRKLNWKLVAATVVFIGFETLWIVMYWLIILTIAFIISFSSIASDYYKFRQKVVTLSITSLGSMIVLHGLFNGGTNRRTLMASKGLIGVCRGFFQDVVLNSNSRLYTWEVWSLVFGPQILVGLAIGLLLSLNRGTRIEQTKHNIKFYGLMLTIFTILLPVVFLFQEYLTYEAWWHRTTPVCISFFSALFIGFYLTVYFRKRQILNESRKILALVPALLLIFTAVETIPQVRPNLDAISKFSGNWDGGDPFGSGSAVENLAPYNLKNFMRIGPYRFDNWIPPDAILNSIVPSISTIDSLSISKPLNIGEEFSSALVTTAASPFDFEIGEKIAYALEVRYSGTPTATGEIVIEDALGKRIIKMNADQISRVHSENTQPGKIRIYILGACPKKATCLTIEKMDISFSEEFRRTWNLKPIEIP